MPDRDAHNDKGGRFTKKAFRGARRPSLMLLASLQFLPRRGTGRVDPRTPEVDGSAPPFFGLPGSTVRGGAMRMAHATLAGRADGEARAARATCP